MAAKMRAKVRVDSVKAMSHGEELHMVPVCRSGGYPSDGSDEDNTFSKFTPSGDFKLTVANPELLGRFKPGDVMYVDFTPVE